MMKKNEIISCIKANKKITDYELTIQDKNSRELFYVLDHLEINRAVKTKTVKIEVYVADKKTVGSSTVTVTAADDGKSLASKLNKAVTKAKQARNAYYPLPEKTENIKDKKNVKRDLNDIAGKVAKAVFKADVYKNGWINSTEIFVSEFTDEFISSKGISHTAQSFKIEVECIPTWSNKKEEFELYKFYESNKPDYRQITAEIDDILKLAKDRSNAKTLKEVDLPKDLIVLVKNDMLEVITDSISSQLSYASVFMHENHYSKNDTISDTAFDLTMKPVVPGCTGSKKYDRNGIVLKPKKIVSKGKAIAYFGDQRFGSYLKEEKISGSLPVCEVKADGVSYKKEKHLIIETFSSPQMEEDSGYWGGEVRLARYYDGKKYIPLTGFSIAGNIYENMKDVQFSEETSVLKNYKGPKYFIFRNIKIS
ncbi:MAG: hypothetical protein J5365_03000 [Erysipelotrichaceae bacterium]|nr:hypothetical protein [Erysipelotrichaceae bacterium]